MSRILAVEGACHCQGDRCRSANSDDGHDTAWQLEHPALPGSLPIGQSIVEKIAAGDDTRHGNLKSLDYDTRSGERSDSLGAYRS